MSCKTAYISHSDCRLHDTGPGHPECAARLEAIEQHLRDSGLLAQLLQREAQPVPSEALARVHPPEHLAAVAAALPSSGYGYLDADTVLCRDSLGAARLAAGAVVQAVDAVMAGECQRAFCAVRPPGHHAETALAMGFCLFNNIAVGVRHALAHWRLQRVAVLDFDVHHGNGTVEIFMEQPQVLVCSSFQHPFFPNRHWDVQRPNIVNSPLPAGSDGKDLRRVVESDWLPALHAHRPQLIMVSAGFDAHRLDPLGGLRLTEPDFGWVSEWICQQAAAMAEGRVVSVLEGGYHLPALAASVHTHVTALMQCA